MKEFGETSNEVIEDLSETQGDTTVPVQAQISPIPLQATLTATKTTGAAVQDAVGYSATSGAIALLLVILIARSATPSLTDVEIAALTGGLGVVVNGLLVIGKRVLNKILPA